MKTKILIFITCLLVNFSSKSQINNENHTKKIEVKLIDYGKISPKYNLKSLSKLTGIKQKMFTSSIYVYTNKGKKEIPIDDNVFNHDFFNNYKYEKNKIIIVHIKLFKTNKEKILIATKVEEKQNK